MLGGGAVAALAMALAALLAYRAWLVQDVSQDAAITGMSLLFGFYVLGIFLFSLGYELYDTGRAIRLTLIVSVLSFLAVVLLAAVGVAVLRLRAGAGAVKGIVHRVDANDGGEVLQSVLGLGVGGPSEDDNPGWFGMKLPEPPPVDPVDFLITCPSCHRRFTPLPPSAICPWCDQPALSA